MIVYRDDYTRKYFLKVDRCLKGIWSICYRIIIDLGDGIVLVFLLQVYKIKNCHIISTLYTYRDRSLIK